MQGVLIALRSSSFKRADKHVHVIPARNAELVIKLKQEKEKDKAVKQCD
jgi:hypothetical protein